MEKQAERTGAQRARRTVYLPNGTNEWLQQQARACGISASEWLVRAIDEVRRERLLGDGVADRLRRAGTDAATD